MTALDPLYNAKDMVIRIYVMMPYTLASSIKTVVLVWLDTPLFAKLIYSTVPGITVSHQWLLLLAC